MRLTDVEFLVLCAQATYTKFYTVDWNQQENKYTVFDSNMNVVLENVPRNIAHEYLRSILRKPSN